MSVHVTEPIHVLRAGKADIVGKVHRSPGICGTHFAALAGRRTGRRYPYREMSSLVRLAMCGDTFEEIVCLNLAAPCVTALPNTARLLRAEDKQNKTGRPSSQVYSASTGARSVRRCPCPDVIGCLVFDGASDFVETMAHTPMTITPVAITIRQVSGSPYSAQPSVIATIGFTYEKVVAIDGATVCER